MHIHRSILFSYLHISTHCFLSPGAIFLRGGIFFCSVPSRSQGRKITRPQFGILMEKLQECDKLVVTKLDRFARTAVEGGAIVQQLHEKGITIHILNMGIADNTPMGKLMVTMLLAFAEFERDMIVERTQTGRQTTGKVGGRPHKYSPEKLELAMDLLAQGRSYSTVSKQTGISKSTLLRVKKCDMKQ